ncbi:MAG TPA: ComEC/Rec2 family competence protein [Pyrinomonadaceae bacterium]|nr:ComEC/Rec2 family competence protein [Pyrinomonadaceae bacterium]
MLAVIALALVAVLLIYFLARKPWRREVSPPSGDELQVHVLDVGQGDSILIVAPGGKSALVDAGVPGSGRVVLDAMQRYGLKEINLLVATHAHADHIGGADEVIGATRVNTVLDSGVPNTTKNYEDFLKAIKKTGAQYVTATPGQTFELGGGAVLSVLAPLKPFFTKEQLRSGGNEPNANSVVTRLDYGRFSMLLTGDAEAQTEQRLIEQGAHIKALILKVGHHGSKYASSEEFLKRGKFEVAIVSDGENNRYGHPSQEALDRFKALGIKLYRTDLQGQITIKTRGEGYEITTERQATGDLWAGRQAQKDDSTRSDSVRLSDSEQSPRPRKERALKR